MFSIFRDCYKFLLGILLFCSSSYLFGQNINFTQFNLVPLYSNTAMIATYDRPQVGLSYRLQYLGKPSSASYNVKGYQSPVYLNALYPLKKNNKRFASLGISFLNDQAGDISLLKTTGGSLAFAYNINFGNNHIALGAEGSFYQRSISQESLLSGAQWTNVGVDNTLPLGIEFQNLNVTYLKANAGIMYYRTKYVQVDSTCGYEKVKGYLGINAKNLNQPNTAFVSQEDKLPLEFTAIAAYNFDIGALGSIQPSVRYIQEGNTNQINGTLMYFHALPGSNITIGGGMGYSSQGSALALAQVQHDKFFAGLSYDYGRIANREQLGGGAVEITAGLKFGRSCVPPENKKEPIIVDSLVPFTRVDTTKLESGDVILKEVTGVDTVKVDVSSGKPKIVDTVKGELTVKVDTVLTGAPSPNELKILEKKVFFHYISAGLNKSGEGLLDEMVSFLRRHPREKIIIQGHSCNIQHDPVKNKALSMTRAKAVMDYLVKSGVSKDRIQIEGYGDEKPILSNETEFGRIKNRRVEFKRVAIEY